MLFLLAKHYYHKLGLYEFNHKMKCPLLSSVWKEIEVHLTKNLYSSDHKNLHSDISGLNGF